MFVGRVKELQFLEDTYSKDQSNIIVLYGHKGVGKTSLMLRFGLNKNLSYYAARECSREEQLYIWNNECGFDFSSDELDFDKVLNGLTFKKDGKRVLVIDEFHSIVKNADDFMLSLMKYVKASAEKIMVVLCSSSISFVENVFVTKIGALAHNISNFYKVPELGFADLVSYFNTYDTYSCVQLYSILGGMPSYWTKVSPKLSVRDNIERCILHPDSFFRDEGLRIVSEELRELNVYCTILNCLSNGMNKLNDLHVHTGYSRAKISVYIKNLMERELVSKIFSFDNASSANAKKGVYRLSNRFLAFYFRFIFKNLSKLNILGPKKFYENWIAPYIDGFYQENFRFVAYEFMELNNQMCLLPFKASKIGEWVGKNGDIDVVLQNEDWDTILCFCNWEKEVLSVEDYNKYLEIAGEARLRPDHIYVISRGEFSAELKELDPSGDKIHFVDLKSL